MAYLRVEIVVCGPALISRVGGTQIEYYRTVYGNVELLKPPEERHLSVSPSIPSHLPRLEGRLVSRAGPGAPSARW